MAQVPNLSDFKNMNIPNFLENQETCKKFCGLYSECLSTLHEAFPDCKYVKNEFELFNAAVTGRDDKEVEFIKKWHVEMKSYYQLVDKKDNEAWKVMPNFSNLKIHDKFESKLLDEEAINVLWEYVDGMSKYSRMYNAIPSNLLNSVQKTALDYVQKVQRGEMKLDINNLNFDEIANIGKDVMSSIDPKDLEEFSNNLTGLASNMNISNMGDIFKLMGDVPGVGEVLNQVNGDDLSGIIDGLLQQEVVKDIMQNADKFLGDNFGKK